MKQLTYFLALIVIGLSSCTSQKKLQTKAPFVIGNASHQDWVGGREESGSGFTLTIPVGETDAVAGYTFYEVFYKGHVLTPSMKNTNGEAIISCTYNKNNKTKKYTTKTFPFELNKNMAVLGYKEAGSDKVKYVKLEGIKEKQRQVYPSKAQN